MARDRERNAAQEEPREGTESTRADDHEVRAPVARCGDDLFAWIPFDDAPDGDTVLVQQLGSGAIGQPPRVGDQRGANRLPLVRFE